MTIDHREALQATVDALAQSGKGILAIDESAPTIKKRFAAIGVESTEVNRCQYRSTLLSTPGLGEFISGVILFEETLSQHGDDGKSIPGLAVSQGIVPGIKVDKGKLPLAHSSGEEITQGLDGLKQRLEEYRSKGARFAKWRDVYHVSASVPSRLAREANADVLASYAAICQVQGLVPVVEPEVLIDGDYSIERAAEVGEAVLRDVFAALYRHRVVLEHILLKPSMVVPGKNHSQLARPEEVAEKTIAVFRRAVPAAVPGINFLSGGQSPKEATSNLDALNRVGGQPWELSFSFGRALQEPALAAWQGRAENSSQTQSALYRRAMLNGAARRGCYAPSMESS